ncbi:MAG: hypothetical protein M3345_02420 [Actinomycetota bacterium]|nr:hypothetical protein [Actinomycetota bacterium]
MSDEEHEDEPGSRRPRVVDKRISARRAAGETIGVPESPPAAEPVTPAPAQAESPAAPSPEPERVGGPPGPMGGPEGVWTPEQEAQAREIAREIAETPSLDWVLQSAVNLANVAGVKLDLGQTADARLAIDALAAMINGVGPQLQGAEQPLRQTLAQLQLAYAQMSGGVSPAAPPSTPPIP